MYKIYWFIFEHFATFYYLYFRRYIEETFNFLMTIVLFMDSFAILVGIISNIPRILKYHTSHHLYFLWPFINIFSQGSTFMIVSMAFERYFASRNPLPTHQVSFQNIKPKLDTKFKHFQSRFSFLMLFVHLFFCVLTIFT